MKTLAMVLLAGAALAQWPEDAAENLIICDATGEQTLPKIAATSDGGCYISWQDHRTANYDTWLQRLDADGVPAWEGGLLVSSHPQETWITDYDLAVDLQDHAIVAINDIRDGSDRDITAYRISPDGDFSWGPDGLAVSRNEGFEPDPRICVTDAGNIVFAWQDESVLHLRKVDVEGRDVWDPAEITLSATYALSIPRLAPAPGDAVLLQFLEAQGSQFWSPKHLKVQRFDSLGVAAWEGLGVAVSTAGGFGPQMRPDLRADGAGGAWCFWYDSRNNQLHAYVQRLQADGTTGWTANGVLLSATAGELQDQPRLVVDESGEGPAEIELYYRITNSNQTQAGIAGQRLSSSGERLWGEGGSILHPLSDAEVNSVVAARGEADSTFVGHFKFSAGNVVDSRIVVEAVDNGGSAAWEVDASSSFVQRGNLVATANGRGQFLAAWKDVRAAEADIRLQNVNPDGNLGPLEDTGVPAFRPRTPVLLTAWPNPFNPSTTIAFRLAEPGPVRLTIHDLAGRKLACVKDQVLPAGEHRLPFHAEGIPAGLYFARLETTLGASTCKVVLVK